MELAFVDEARLLEVEHHMNSICGVRMIDRVFTDVFWNRVGFVVKIEDMIFEAVCSGMVISSNETSAPKYLRLWSLK